MNEKRTFKKRLAGLFAMALVLAMMIGMTVNAAGTAYYVECDNHEPGAWEWNGTTYYSYTLCTDSDCKTPANNVSTLSGGDTITVSPSGYLFIYLDGTQKTRLEDGDRTYTIPDGTYSYAIEKGVGERKGTLNLTTYNSGGSTPATPAPTDEQEEKSCSHGGKYSKVIKEPTETEDGIVGWFCEKCDEKLYEEYMSSYAYFLKSTIEKINKAEPGSTVEINSKVWNSLSQDVMLAMAARRDINIVMTLRYQHEDYSYTIPAGTAIDTTDKYYGPMYLGQLYGMTKVEK